jgi:hypothetical protein
MRSAGTTVALLSGVISLSAAVADAQWLNHPTAGAPRRTDGKVNMQAPAPRTADGHPDLSGVWGWQPGRYVGSLAIDLKPAEIKPEAAALARARAETLGRDDPGQFACLPQGPRQNLYAPIPFKIVQTPTLLVILSEDLSYRQIFLDGRPLPKDPDPSFMGYSTGHWEGDTLVVETIGFKDRTWLDFAGTPHSESLKITERIRRRTFGRLEIEETIDDPEVFTRPFTVMLGAQYAPDTELLEFVCGENERSRQHFVGTLSEMIKEKLSHTVTVAPEILERYVGDYEFRYPESPSTPHVFPIRLVDGHLRAGEAPLIPLSDTRFGGPFGDFEVKFDEHGRVTHLLVTIVEGDVKVFRLPDAK